MKYFYIHPSDARWLRRWLAKNLVCVLAIVCFLVTVRFAASVPIATMNRANADQTSRILEEQSPETELESPASSRPVAVAPQGWRRTADGWEHVSTWAPAARPLGEIIKSQEDREPAWMQLVLAKLRSMPPLIFALLQITAVAAIVNARSDRKEIA